MNRKALVGVFFGLLAAITASAMSALDSASVTMPATNPAVQAEDVHFKLISQGGEEMDRRRVRERKGFQGSLIGVTEQVSG